ncbi:MAG TPA: AraC family transcriptional regulator [Kofleriaceae bacterium]|nr:AraC family transcriptional regulator [Kofleriaceae bacterium]
MSLTTTSSPGVMRAGVMRGLRRHLAAYAGVSADGLLRDAGIRRDAGQDPDVRLHGRRVIELLQRAARETGDAAFALRYAEQLSWQDLGVLAHVVLHSSTLGTALTHACRYLAVQQTVGRATLEVVRGTARLTYTVIDASVGDHAQHSESVLALTVRLVREGLGDEAWAPRAVSFRHRAPAHLDVHRRFFRAPLRFGAPHDGLVLGAAELRLPFRTADPTLLPTLLRHADDVLARGTRGTRGDVLADVRREVIEALGRGDVSIETVAAALGVAPRSLQRRLHEHELSFKDVVAEARLALARRYLGDPDLSLTDAAFLLGYSDLSAFSRAFRRWTGTSPQTARRSRG